MKKLSQLLESINEIDSLMEIDFKDKESFQKYQAKHKMRPSTKVNIAGKETTVGDEMGDDSETPKAPKKTTGADIEKQASKSGKKQDDIEKDIMGEPEVGTKVEDGKIKSSGPQQFTDDIKNMKGEYDLGGGVKIKDGKMFDADGEEMDDDDIDDFYYQDAYDEDGNNVGIDISSKNENFDLRELSKITTRYTNRLDERSTLTLRGNNGKLVDVPSEYSRIVSGIDRLMSKFNPRGVMFGYRKYHKLKPNDEYSGSIILKNPLSKKDIDVVMKHLKSAGSSLGFKFEKITFNPDRNEPFVEFRVDDASIK